MKILVVEDTENARILLVDLLQVQGYTVEWADNGVVALAKALDAPPQLIISDILMPEMDGFELCKRIKKQPSLASVPFIFYTATYTDASDCRFALSLGADRFIVKPEEPVKLLQIIDDVLSQQASVATVAANKDTRLGETFERQHAEALARKLDKKIGELEGQKDQLRVITDAMPALIAEIDSFGRYLYVNQKFANWFQLSIHEIVDKNFSELEGGTTKRVIEPYVQRALAGEDVTYEGYVRDSAGEQRYILARHLPHKSVRNKNSCLLFITNLSEQKIAEEERQQLVIQLRNSQKMDALGKLTCGIAHDYNNMLGVVLGFAELAQNRINPATDPKLADFVREITSAGERGKNLTQKMLDFAKYEQNESTFVDVNKLLRAEQNLLEKTLTVRIKLIYSIDSTLWPVYLNSGEMSDAILNLSINAMHAIEGNGQLTMHANNLQMDTYQAQQLELAAGDYVVLVVEDTGCGIENTIQEKIFDPFFTTKDEHGTGLGLSQVYGFVRRSGGAIRVDSELGVGARFSLYFPRAFEAEIEQQQVLVKTVPAETKPAKIPVDSTATLLVVDDEIALTKLAEKILVTQGYNVLTANSGRQALAILKHESVSVLITDIVMPEMDGYQLAAQVQLSYPGTKVQLVSGFVNYRFNIDTQDKTLYRNILYKPYQSKNLLQKIHNLLTEKQNSGRKIDQVAIQIE